MSKQLLVVMVLLVLTGSLGAQAPDAPPGPARDPATASPAKLAIGEHMLRIKEATSASLVRHYSNRFSVFIDGGKLGNGWKAIAEKEAKLVYKEEFEKAEKAKKAFVKQLLGVTLVAYKATDSFTGCVFTFEDYDGQTRLLNIPLDRSPELVERTADFLERSIDNAALYAAFLAAIGGGSPPLAPPK